MGCMDSTPPSLDAIVRKLDGMHGAPVAPPTRDPFELVVWENVAYLVDDTRRQAAFDLLRARVGLTPLAIAAASDDALYAVTRLGGMHPERRVDTLRAVARVALELGDLDAVARQPLARARRAFTKFPSLGEPGAEKVLLFAGHHAVLALESNGLRVLLRLGYGEENKSYARSYRSVREALGELPANAERLTHAHQQLRKHGQEICRRTGPHCEICVLRTGCAHFRSA